MFRKYSIILLMISSLSLTGCNNKNQYIKYYKIFPDKEQNNECFGDGYYCLDDEISEEWTNEHYESSKSIGMCYRYDGTNRFIYGLYGKLYYDDFEIYFIISNYNCSLDSAKLRLLDELQEYLDQLYNLIDTNRIEAE